MKIVPTTRDMLPRLAECFRAAYAPQGEIWSSEKALEFITFKFNRWPDLSFAAVRNGEPVGAIFTDMKPWHDGPHLCEGELFVHPKHQGNPFIAIPLALALINTAKRKYNCSAIEGVTFKKGNQLSMYEKIGYKEDPTLTFITGNIDVMLEKLAPYQKRFGKIGIYGRANQEEIKK